MFLHMCSNNHTSYSASKNPKDPTCPQCGEPTQLVDPESQDAPTRPQS